MNRDSVIFYKSFYEALKELPSEQQGEVYNAIFQYQFEGIECKLSGISKTVFTLIKPQLDANNIKYENGCKGGRPKNLNEAKQKPKQNLNETKTKPNENVNENDNENVNVEGEWSDSCADGSQQSDSCADEIVQFYNENIGAISPYEYEVLDSFRDTFSDDIILFALKLQVEAKADGINYAKAILNNWQKKNIRTLLDAQNENKKRKSKEAERPVNNTFHNTQYGDLSKYYV